MSSYLAFVPAVLSCALVIAIPGFIVGLGLRLRGLWLAALLPVLGLTAVGVTSVVAPVLGLSWSLWPVLGAAVIAAVGLRILTGVVPALRSSDVATAAEEPGVVRNSGRTWLFRAVASRWIRQNWATATAMVVASLIICWQLTTIISDPETFIQRYDNVFHLNAVRWVLETGNGSPFELSRLTSPSGKLAFYPSAWHAWCALVAQVAGASVPASQNAAVFVAAGLIWPSGVVLWVRTIWGTHPVLLLTAGVAAAAFPAFPILLINYGVLYPMFLSYALIPAALAVMAQALKVRKDRQGNGRWLAALTLLAVLGTMVLIHPAGFVAVVLFSGPMVVLAAIRFLRTRPGTLRTALCAAALICYAVGVVTVLRKLRPDISQLRFWSAEMSLGDAVVDVFIAGVDAGPPAVLIAILAALGIVFAVVRRDTAGWTAIGLWVVASTLYVIAAASPSQALRIFATGSFYTNIPRLAALYPVATVALVALAGQQIADWVWRFWQLRTGKPMRRLVAGSSLAVAMLLLVAGTQGTAMRHEVAETRAAYSFTKDSKLLTPDELAMFAVVEKVVPKGDLIAGNPWTGAGLAYAYTGRPVLLPHLLMEITPPTKQFIDGFAKARHDDPGCVAARSLRVRWVLDFGGARYGAGAKIVLQGLTGLDKSKNVELVDQIGEAKLYRVVGCGIR